MDSHNQTVETPRPSLSVLDACAIIVGVVVGVGIFRTPSIVAANVPNEATFLLAWVLGGLVSLAGALCYAELATTYPHAGGDYHYLSRAFGKDMAFLFAWARLVVIQSGSIALLSFVFRRLCHANLTAWRTLVAGDLCRSCGLRAYHAQCHGGETG